MISFEYDNQRYDPAMPVAIVGLGFSRESTAQIEVTALIDSGADATMMPILALQAAGARYVDRRLMRGVVGERVEVRLYLTAVHIGSTIIHGVHVVGMPAESEPILGRDVLNQLQVILDGPAYQTTLT